MTTITHKIFQNNLLKYNTLYGDDYICEYFAWKNFSHKTVKINNAFNVKIKQQRQKRDWGFFMKEVFFT